MRNHVSWHPSCVQCSVTCGYGVQKRRVFCQRDPSDPKEEPQVVDSSQCSEEQPPATLTCRFDPCLDGSNAHSMVEVEVCFMCWETLSISYIFVLYV